MQVLVLGHAEVQRLLPMAACVDVMEQALRARARGQAQMPLRQVVWLGEDRRGALAWMPAYLPGMGAAGAKVISVFPANSRTPYDSHQGPVLLFEPEHGRLLAMLDASSLTAIRTAAVSAAATRALARTDARRLAVIGTGTQAFLHVEAMRTVRAIDSVAVWGRSPERAQRLAERVRAQFALPAEAVGEARAAVDGADIVCTATASPLPVVLGEWLAKGAHVNAVGASVPGFRELDAEAYRRSRVYVDAVESARAESDEIRLAVAEGAIEPSHVRGELGDLLEGTLSGRAGAEEITLFKSLGLAVEDVACARFIYDKALEAGLGTAVEFASERTI